jgi:hypothetical protein
MAYVKYTQGGRGGGGGAVLPWWMEGNANLISEGIPYIYIISIFYFCIHQIFED